ncbi:MAG: hypothetical protein LAT52_05045 [Balneolales bacterium]|nr:hypothetical protein [Balneolales bacterium]
MKTRNLHFLIRFSALILFSQTLLTNQLLCANGGWLCTVAAGESTACCPENSFPDDLNADFCHPPSAAEQPFSDCDNCSVCNFDGADYPLVLPVSVVPSGATGDELLAPQTGQLQEYHSDEASPNVFVFLSFSSPSHSEPLYVFHQSFLN